MAVASRGQATSDAVAVASGDGAAGAWTDVFSSRWMLGVILLLTAVAYAPTLNDWFTGDDFWFLHSAQTQPWGDYTQRVFDYRESESLPELNRYRPLYPLAWKLQYELFGTNPEGYHAAQLAAHLGAVVLAWFLFRRLLDRPWLANLGALIFALHPIHAGTIAWISSNRVIAGVPYIAALLLFLKSRDEGERWKWAWYGGALLLYVASILLHSAATTLALALPVYVFFVDQQPKDALRWRNWVSLAPFIAIAAAYTLVQWQVRDEILFDNAFRFGGHQFSMYGALLGMFALPIETIEQGQSWDAFFEKVQLLGAVTAIFLGFAILYRRPLWGIAVFAWLWFLLALLPDSTFIAGPSGRMLYMAAVPGALTLVLMMVYVRDLLPGNIRRSLVAAAPYALALVIVPLVIFTLTRAQGVSDRARGYEDFAATLQRDGPDVPAGGTLYIVGRPEPNAFSPDSHVTSLAGLYYDDDVDVVLVKAGQPTPALGPDDRVFQYSGE